MDPISESAKQLGLQKLKEKQLEAVSSFVQGHDTFVSLPTGYGKSVIYAILPYVFDQLKGTGCMVWVSVIQDSCMQYKYVQFRAAAQYTVQYVRLG